MASQLLITDAICEGKYVATASFFSNEVVSLGDNPVDVMENARKAGVKKPVLNFIPEHEVCCVY